MDYFTERCSFEPNTGCWLWLRCVNHHGYGSLGFGGKTYLAHRFSYEKFNGPIPAGYEIDHLCRVRCCVNPQHLEAVTNRENVIRGKRSSLKESKTSPYLGVFKHSNGRQWYSQINIAGKSIYLGLFNNPEAAAVAYANAREQSPNP